MGAALSQLVRVLVLPRGGWRSALLWRFLGAAIFQLGILYVAHVENWQLFSAYGLQWLFPAGLLLMIGGGRIAVLLTTWCLTLLHYGTRLGGSAEVQLAEEYALFLSLPLLGIIAVGVGAYSAAATGAAPLVRSDDNVAAAIDEATVALFRVAAVTTLLWATLHKINADFLNEAVSCGPLLARELAAWWSLSLPAVVTDVSPWRVIWMEGLSPVLLVLFPRVGLLWTTVVIGVIGHRGATAFVVLAVGLALSFLRAGDRTRLLVALRRWWPLILLVYAVGLGVSAKTYTGPRHWYEAMFMQVVLFGALLAPLYLLFDDIARWWRERGEAERERDDLALRLLPSAAAGRWFVGLVFALFMVNGLTPYLGWKYRLSFAMLSNLRVDDVRWNSLVFPKELRLARYDEHVHVVQIDADQRSRDVLAGLPQKKRALRVGLISPKSLDYRMKYVKYHDLTVDLHLMYKGRPMFFSDVAHSADFERWLDRLPKTNLIQEFLVESGPQPCTH